VGYGATWEAKRAIKMKRRMTIVLVKESGSRAMTLSTWRKVRALWSSGSVDRTGMAVIIISN
jgi:hypothetical protein